MKLFEYLHKEVPLTESLAQSLEDLFQYVELPRGEQLMTEGSYSKKVYYIEEGLMRLYYLKDGKDITHQFFAEKAFYLSIENVFLQKSFPYRLELLENSRLQVADFSRLEGHIESNPLLQRFVIYLMTSVIKLLSDHLYSIQFQSAQDRYKSLLENRPEILLRAPLGHIASYLGITQQTLSVIRSGKLK